MTRMMVVAAAVLAGMMAVIMPPACATAPLTLDSDADAEIIINGMPDAAAQIIINEIPAYEAVLLSASSKKHRRLVAKRQRQHGDLYVNVKTVEDAMIASAVLGPGLRHARVQNVDSGIADLGTLTTLSTLSISPLRD